MMPWKEEYVTTSPIEPSWPALLRTLFSLTLRTSGENEQKRKMSKSGDQAGSNYCIVRKRPTASLSPISIVFLAS